MVVDLKDEIRYRGYEPNPKIIIPNENLLSIYELIKDFDMNEVEYKRESLRSILVKAKEFFDKYYELHKVPFEIFKKVGPFDFSYDCEISPFWLPIKRVDEDAYYGMLRELIVCGEETRTVFTGIELPKIITEASTLSYVHEITHSQDNHIYGSIRNYYNTELLSVFNELLCAGSMDDGGKLSHLADVLRLSDLKYGIKFLQDGLGKEDEKYNELAEASCYVESTLKAYNMYMDYYSGDKMTRQYIILMIQKVFDGEITLEQCLEALDITYPNSLSPKKLTKFLKR